MIVCSCFGITDGDLRDSVRAGQPAAAGTCCGSCLPLVSDLVAKLKEKDSVLPEPDQGKHGTERSKAR